MSGAAVARRLGISKSTVSYRRRRLGQPIDERCNRRYDWVAVQCFYDEGHTITECQEHFGFARKTFMDAVARGVLITRPQSAPVGEYLVRGRRVNRTHLKGRLLTAGLRESLRALWNRGLARRSSFDGAAPRERRGDRQPPREPDDAVSQLPRADAEFLR